MKKMILVLCAVSAFMVAQDAAGTYKLSAVDVLYTFITRDANTLTISDAYGIGVTVPVKTIPAGVPFTTQPMQLNDAALGSVGINLNVQLNEDGTGSIAEGSYYPDVNTITDEHGNCVTLQQVLPVTDEFTYTSNAGMMAEEDIVHTGVNVLGQEGISPKAGQQLGGLSLSSSLTFENFPSVPTHTELCTPAAYCNHDVENDPDGSLTPNIVCYPTSNHDIETDPDGSLTPDIPNCFDFMDDVDEDGAIIPTALGGVDLYTPAGAPLGGYTAGLWLKAGVNVGELESIYPGNTTPDFHLEWHGVDGASSSLGFGEDEDADEDGDLTWYDRTVGIPSIPATLMNPACGFNLPIYGDVSAIFAAQEQSACVDAVGTASSAYLMDASLAAWGNFMTKNAATYSGTASALTNLDPDAGPVDPAGYMAGCGATGAPTDADVLACMGACQADDDPAACSADCVADCAAAAVQDHVIATNPGILANDGGYDLGSLYDHDDDETTPFEPHSDGRLTMNFDIPCVGIIEAREVIAEFIEVGLGECGTGDVATPQDGAINVLDVVALVNIVLANGYSCEGDMNADNGVNVLDIVALVNLALGSRADEASSATFEVIGNEVTMTANGYVGAVQMTLSHGTDFQIVLTDNALAADYSTEGTTTTLIVVAPEGNALFTTTGDFTIESVLAAANSESYMDTKIVVPGDFAISAAYPNPFNPTTQMTLALHTQADVSVKVFNMAGQLVDVIADGQMDKGSYSLNWDGTNASSGVYFVKTEVGSVVQNQKIMLIK